MPRPGDLIDAVVDATLNHTATYLGAVDSQGGRFGYRAVCACGVVSEAVPTTDDAADAHRQHVRQVMRSETKAHR